VIKLLYVILVLSTIAVVSVALAIFLRVRRHLSQKAEHHTSEVERQLNPAPESSPSGRK